MVPADATTANALECQIIPMSRGDHQQPMKKPTKCAEPSIPMFSVENPDWIAENASSGPNPPELSWIRITACCPCDSAGKRP